MASYLPGVQDYIPQYQPFQPDYNFLGNMLQTAQSKYDQNYKQLSKTYGTLLNSPMLAADNIQQRDEFFKMIDGDIKRISGMDLSLQQNVDTANTVFDSFYKNKDMVKDMVYTKEYQNQLEIGDSFRNCLDQEKCGGKYWDDGVAYLNYKAEDFKNASREERLNMSPGKFTPFINVHEKAVKLAKEAGLNVKQDIDTGKWIVTKKNGELVQGGLYSLFNTTLGSDPTIKEMYNVSAYTKRRQFADANIQQYGSKENAELAYINNILDAANKNINEQTKTVSDASDQGLARQAELSQKAKTIGLNPEERDALLELEAVLPNLSTAQNDLSTANNAINISGDNINVLRSRADAAAAHLLSSFDFTTAAQTLSLKDAEITIAANPYSLASHNSALSLSNQKTMAQINRVNALEKLNVEHGFKLDEEQFKYNLETGAVKGLDGQGGAGNPISISDANWSIANLGGENEEYVFNKNLQVQQEQRAGTSSAQLIFLKDLALAAKAVKTPGATQLLEKLIGKDGDISKLENLKPNDLKKLYNIAATTLTQKDPLGDMSWSKLFVERRSKTMMDISQGEQAEKAITKRLALTNEKVLKKIKSEKAFEIADYSISDLINAKDQKDLEKMISKKKPDTDPNYPSNYYADADLILKNGHLVDQKTFTKSYIQKHSNDPRYIQRKGIKLASFVLNMDLAEFQIMEDAENAFDAVTEKFYHTYNRTEGAPLDQGYGLSGGGTLQAKPLIYSGVDAAQWQSQPMVEAARDFRTFAANNQGVGTTIKFGIGDPTEENIVTDPLTNFQLNKVMLGLSRDLNTKYKPGAADRPLFNYMLSPIAANNPDMASRTIYLDPKSMKKYVGDKANPGPLYGIGEQLNNGFTVYYDKDKIKLGADEASEDSNLDIIATYGGGVKYDISNSGNANITKDTSTGDIVSTMNIISWDNKKKVTQAVVNRYPENTTIAPPYQAIKNFLLTNMQENNYLDAEANKLNAAGYMVPGYTPPSMLQQGVQSGVK